MTMQVLLYAIALIAGVVSAVIAVFAFLYHKRDFWKITQFEEMREDQKTVEGLKVQVAEKQTEHDRLTGEIADARATLDEAKVCKDYIVQHPTWKADKEALEKGIAETQEKVRKITEELVTSQQRRDELLKEIAAYDGKLNRLKEIQEETEKLQKEKEELEKKVAPLRLEYAELDKKVKELESVLDKLNKGTADAENKLTELIGKQRQAEKARAKAESEKQVMENQLKGLRDQCDSAKATLTNLEKLLDNIKKARQETVEIEAKAFDGLYKPVFGAGAHVLQRTADAAAQERAALQRLKAHVEERGFVFSERLLSAFHTALKTSDISCLTVMAGVSGTGKSALPKLYAEAMGIHFTLLAVEPRWDSPRDLFGFFNYMENRYEPTSLARALVQFNSHENNAQKQDMSSQMLMVLLDEMNLARIEYYFSEYLSKLELRREEKDNITGPNSEGYRKVSMELFAGRKINGADEDPIRLFAGSNVLFVGTMNEDETTQSLSDKVIDRANVLHFSRPLTLQNRSEQQKRDHVTQAMITREAWESWQRQANDGVEPMAGFANQLNQLNVILGYIGRPFAHRTYQAMMAYIANYPYDNENARKRALADQIAMRVMPKLRGLDLDQHRAELDQIAGHIQQLNDPAMLHAFGSAMNNKQGFFRWQGINWDENAG